MTDNEKLESDGENEVTVMQTNAVNVRKKPFSIMGVEFVYIFLFGIGCAFIGWAAENTARLVTQGIVDSRFHILPLLPPYALIPFAFQILLGDPDDVAVFGRRLFKKKTLSSKILSNIVCFLLICAAVFFGELVTGNLWEKIFGVQLWNYSNIPLHVTQYTGLIPAVGYGTGAFLIFRLIYRPVIKLMQSKLNYGIAKVICLSLGTLMLLDAFCLVLSVGLTGESPVYWAVKLW